WPNFPQTIRAALEKHDVPPELLTFEITESSVMTNPGRSLPVLRALHAMGIRLSVDDFGTGYSSLAYLRRLPLNEIKIDKSFVQRLARDASDAVIVRSTIELAHNMGLNVVAEGVEDEATLERLRALGCDLVHGYFLSRPLAARDVAQWLG